MSHMNNTKKIIMFQTTPQTQSIINTKVLVIFDRFQEVWLIIINNILVIVSGITQKKKEKEIAYVSQLLALAFYFLVV